MQNEARGLERKGADIEERLLEFAVRVGKAIDTLPDTRLGRHIAGQLVRSGTSPAPNYAEACAAESKKDFIHKLAISSAKSSPSRSLQPSRTNRALKANNTTSKHFALSNFHYSLIIFFEQLSKPPKKQYRSYQPKDKP